MAQLQIGEPGQRETTRAGLEHDYYLVIRQVKMAVIWGWGIIFLLMAGVFAFWVRSDARACWRCWRTLTFWSTNTSPICYGLLSIWLRNWKRDPQ